MPQGFRGIRANSVPRDIVFVILLKAVIFFSEDIQESSNNEVEIHFPVVCNTLKNIDNTDNLCVCRWSTGLYRASI